MNIQQLIAKHIGAMKISALHEAVNASLEDQGEPTVVYETVRKCVKHPGSRPGRIEEATALARALRVEKTDVFEALGWIDGDGLHERVTRIEQVLRKAGLLPDDELSVPGKIKSAVKVDHPVGDTAENVERPA